MCVCVCERERERERVREVERKKDIKKIDIEKRHMQVKAVHTIDGLRKEIFLFEFQFGNSFLFSFKPQTRYKHTQTQRPQTHTDLVLAHWLKEKCFNKEEVKKI